MPYKIFKLNDSHIKDAVILRIQPIVFSKYIHVDVGSGTHRYDNTVAKVIADAVSGDLVLNTTFVIQNYYIDNADTESTNMNITGKLRTIGLGYDHFTTQISYPKLFLQMVPQNNTVRVSKYVLNSNVALPESVEVNQYKAPEEVNVNVDSLRVSGTLNYNVFDVSQGIRISSDSSIELEATNEMELLDFVLAPATPIRSQS